MKQRITIEEKGLWALAGISLLIASAPAGAQMRGRRGFPAPPESRPASVTRPSDSGASPSFKVSAPGLPSTRSEVARPGFSEPAAGRRATGKDSRNNSVSLPARGSVSTGSVVFSPPSPSASELPSVNLPVRPNPLANGAITRPRLPQRSSTRWDDNAAAWPSGKVVFLRPGQVIRLNDYGTTLFTGYATTCAPGVGYVSPFAVYNCPPYVGVNSVLINTPYPYGNGREVSALPLWDGDGRAGMADNTRSRFLRAALNDLTRFWEENDGRALRRRISPGLAVAVFSEERHLYSLRQTDFLALAGDALDRVQTLSFRFYTVRDRNDGLVNAYATHVYRLRGDGSGTPRVSTLRYTLVYVDGDWIVSAMSLSADMIARG